MTFGGTAGTNVARPDANTITATTPAHAAGTVNVVVTNGMAQSGTLTNAFTYTTAPPTGGGGGSTGGTVRFVQVKSATPHPTSTSVAVTYSAAQTAGNLNVVEVGWNDTTSSVSSVTDSRGNGYVLAVGPTRGTGLTQSIYYAKNIVGGTNTVTVTFNKAAAIVDVRALEYSGLDTANPLDVTAAAAGTGTTGNSGAATTRSANELIVGAGMTAGAFTKAGAGFTSRIITSPDADIAEDGITTAAGNYSATAPTSTSTPWVMQMAAFRTGSSAPPVPPVPPAKHSVSISWDPSPSTDVAYYKVYRGTVAGGPYNSARHQHHNRHVHRFDGSIGHHLLLRDDNGFYGGVGECFLKPVQGRSPHTLAVLELLGTTDASPARKSSRFTYAVLGCCT